MSLVESEITSPQPSLSTSNEAGPNHAEKIRAIWQVQEDINQYTDPRSVATAITQELGSDIATDKLERAFLRMDTAPHVYEGAKETTKELLDNGDQVIIWTQGHEKTQLYKVAIAGFHELRRNLPPEERQRFSVFAAKDKLSSLPELVQTLVSNGSDEIIIVDDKSKNIDRVGKVVQQLRDTNGIPDNVKVTPIWINQGRSKGKVPDGHTLETFTEAYRTIQDIRELSSLPVHQGAKRTWLLDFDHTLLHTAAARNVLFSNIGEWYRPSNESNSYLPHKIKEVVGLNGNVRRVEPLKSGMSGNAVMRVDTHDQSIVIKYNLEDPTKVQHEMHRYKRLEGTPLSQYLLPVLHASEDHGIIVQPFFDGVQMREGVKNELLSADTVENAFSELMAAKLVWWSEQEKVYPNGDLVSMQREEWIDTSINIDATLHLLADKFNISVEGLKNKPINFRASVYMPLAEVVDQVQNMLENYPPYAVLAHNDATGANILVEPNGSNWKIIDTEWAGYGDPAEAYTRMVKYISTTTAKSIDNVSIAESELGVHVNLDAEFPQAATRLQALGEKMSGVFAKNMGDPDFATRFRTYLAGSYLREIALATRRKKPEYAVLAMLKASEVLQ